MGKAPSLLHGMEVVVNKNSLLLRNPQRLEIGGLDSLPDSRWPFKKELRADLDATDRLANHTVLAGAVVLRIKLLKFENCIEVKGWLRVSQPSNDLLDLNVNFVPSSRCQDDLAQHCLQGEEQQST